MTNDRLGPFIEEAFIHPIRSVLIVDDDYPTFTEILTAKIASNAGQDAESEKSWRKNPDDILRLIRAFRNPERPLLVDIHDGSNIGEGQELRVAAHLHQTDLLVLDFELDKSRPADGSRAIAILDGLMSNDHFNMVVVHSKEDLDEVFRQVLLALLEPVPEIISEADSDQALNLIESTEEAHEGVGDRINLSVGTRQYLDFRKNPDSYVRSMCANAEPYARFKGICDEVGWARSQPGLILNFALAQAQEKLTQSMSVKPQGDLIWGDEQAKWMKTSSVFVAFSKKSPGSDILSELARALSDWKPQPPRLFLTRLRAEMDEYGVVAQSKALDNRHALAFWYERLLKADEPERKWLLADSIARQTDQLLIPILPRVEDFGRRLVSADMTSEAAPIDICRDHFSVNLGNESDKRKAEREHNAYVCSMNPRGWHLTTGHVFEMDSEYWVCVSPACDMVPVQMSASNAKQYDERLPFVAFRLVRKSAGKELGDVQSNRHIFLRMKDGIKVFSINEASNASPEWQVLYAESRGYLGPDFEFAVLRTEAARTKLVCRKYKAFVISQLRYEYALNLMQKLGVSITRIGLDFAGG